jgi:hypothetical protein
MEYNGLVGAKLEVFPKVTSTAVSKPEFVLKYVSRKFEIKNWMDGAALENAYSL